MNLYELAGRIGVEGFLHCNELDQLVELAAGKDVLEVGSFKGLSAWGMAISARSLLCVDTFKANSAGQHQQQEYTTLDAFRKAVDRYTNVKFLAMPSLEAAKVVGETFDFIFLDAMHTYEDVKDDIEAWWPKLRDGGVLAFHDYGHDHFPGVQKAVEERFGPLPNRVVTLGWLTKT